MPKPFSHKAFFSASCHGQKSLFNVALQLLMPSLSFRGTCINRSYCFFWLQGNACSVHNAQAIQITLMQSYNPTLSGNFPQLTFSPRLFSMRIWDLFSLSNGAMLDTINMRFFFHLTTTMWVFFHIVYSQWLVHQNYLGRKISKYRFLGLIP